MLLKRCTLWLRAALVSGVFISLILATTVPVAGQAAKWRGGQGADCRLGAGRERLARRPAGRAVEQLASGEARRPSQRSSSICHRASFKQQQCV